MSGFLLLFHPRCHPVELLARAFHLAVRLFPLLAVHLRQRFGQPAGGALQDGGGHLQIAP
jgi:hypothetical protein